MKPVMQTSDDDCVPACIKSILEIDDVPHFVKLYDYQWFVECNKWLRDNYGLTLIRFDADNGELPDRAYHVAGGTLCMLGGPTNRGTQHSVVGITMHKKKELWLEFLHDPHPSGDYLEAVTEVEYFGLVDPKGRECS